MHEQHLIGVAIVHQLTSISQTANAFDFQLKSKLKYQVTTKMFRFTLCDCCFCFGCTEIEIDIMLLPKTVFDLIHGMF